MKQGGWVCLARISIRGAREANMKSLPDEIRAYLELLDEGENRIITTP